MFESLSQLITYNLFQLQPESTFGMAAEFWIYSVIKILTLVFIVVSLIAFVRTYVHPDKTRALLAKMPFGVSNLIASLFGALSPFCSCSSIPLFIGFLQARMPAGVAFSFLITSPLVNEVAFVIMGGYFGWKIAIYYALAGIMLGVVGGIIIQMLGLEKELIYENKEGQKLSDNMPTVFKKRVSYAVFQGYKVFKSLLPYVLGGITIGAFVHGYVPQEWFTNTLGKYEVLSVPIATIIGIPIYAGCSMIAPIVFSITANGVPLGTSLALMMSISGLSLPEAIILKRTMTTKMLAIFFSLVAVGIIIIGYLFNLIA